MKKIGDFLSTTDEPKKSSAQETPSKIRSTDFFRLQEKWESIVGTTISENGIPIKIFNDSLVILTKHPLFSQNISFMEPMIIEKINTAIPSLRNQFRSFKYQCNPDLFLNLTTSKNSAKVSSPVENFPPPNSPRYQKLMREATTLFKDISDQDLRGTLIKIYISSQIKNAK